MFAKTEKPNGKAAAHGGMPSIVAADMRIKGQIETKGDAQIDGTVEGDVKVQHLVIGATGRIAGEVVAESVQVSGAVEGRIHARTVTLARTAKVTGDIAHESLAIEAGARFEGQVTRLEKPQTQVQTAPQSAAPVVGVEAARPA
jgi:cytoskeletal protein CcmA (bactofilin family)